MPAIELCPLLLQLSFLILHLSGISLLLILMLESEGVKAVSLFLHLLSLSLLLRGFCLLPSVLFLLQIVEFLLDFEELHLLELLRFLEPVFFLKSELIKFLL